MTPKEKILVAIPCVGGQMHSNLHTWAVSLKKNNPSRDYQVLIVNEAKPVDYARNLICQKFLKEGTWDRLWFVDSDTLPPEDFAAFLDVDADIVVGQVPVWIPNGYKGAEVGSIVLNVYKYVGENDKFKPINPMWQPTVEDVDAGGCACMVVRRKVIEDERLRYAPSYLDIEGTPKKLADDDPPAIFRVKQKPNGQWLIGEDLLFCYRAKQMGYDIKTFGLRCGHFKMMDLWEGLKLNNVMYSKGAEDATKEPEEAA